MEYKTPSPKLQDIQTKTVELWATAAELGELNAGNLEIAVSALTDDVDSFAADNVFQAINLTISSQALTATVTAGVLTLDGSSAITATNELHLVLRLP